MIDIHSAQSMGLPGDDLDVAKMPGHWLLAHLGKRVLRPGGLRLTQALLDGLAIGPADEMVEERRSDCGEIDQAAGPAEHLAANLLQAAALPPLGEYQPDRFVEEAPQPGLRHGRIRMVVAAFCD